MAHPVDLDFQDLLRSTRLSCMTSTLQDQLHVFSGECSKESCLAMLQALGDMEQRKLAIRTLLVYRIKAICFRHCILLMLISRVPSTLADMLLEDRTLSFHDAVDMAFDEAMLLSFVSGKNEVMCESIVKYDASLTCMSMQMMARERQMVLDLNKAQCDTNNAQCNLNKAQCDLEEQLLTSEKFSLMAQNLQHTLDEYHMQPAQERHDHEEVSTYKSVIAVMEEEGVAAAVRNGQQLAALEALQQALETAEAEGAAAMRTSPAEHGALEEALAALAAAQAEGAAAARRHACALVEMREENAIAERARVLLVMEERSRLQLGAAAAESEAVRRTEVLHKKNMLLEKDLNHLRGSKASKDRVDERAKKDVEKVHRKLMDTEQKLEASETRLSGSEERVEAAAVLFTLMQKDLKHAHEQGEAYERLMTIDFRKMEIYESIQQKLRLDLKKAPCTGLAGTRILARVQGGAADVMARCWKEYASRKGKRELRERVLSEAADVMARCWKGYASRKGKRELRERVLGEKAELTAQREYLEACVLDEQRRTAEWLAAEAGVLEQGRLSVVVAAAFEEDTRAEAVAMAGAMKGWTAEETETAVVELEAKTVIMALVSGACEGAHLGSTMPLEGLCERSKTLGRLALDAVIVTRVLDMKEEDCPVKRVLFEKLMLMSDKKRMLYTTMVWNTRRRMYMHEVPSAVLEDFRELCDAFAQLPGSLESEAWTRMIETYGPDKEESRVASAPPRRKNWPERRGDFRVLYQDLHGASRRTCALALVPWLERSNVKQDKVCSRIKCGVPLVAGCVRCAQCCKTRYCSAECGVADAIHHDAECHLHTLRFLFRMYCTRGMASDSVVEMFYGSKPVMDHRPGHNAGCYCHECLQQRVFEARNAGVC